ncbi:nucleotidyl transferase AbiEii/AbiGii toxin family protein [Dactylosporangium aurantiacum]|uniref:Nucleotidyl transferase AbiEii/AbiGii toxin family protein n=1 Tax=Dactylosporangium aurantiacum TaxID=35754 RepID=A0A9Q9IEW3_9ACTN|nr:nucleotidyl transferase AbiEii/AbiGii toxin family protein [Dactylosporangium aurantiacum]MDG6101176.1 nucleotidyl transferase AbiEii/AbiGii toxin family protein [Dactylosporangium aurantiacum]UWZ54797.1 nucleotidyl transferase AbiEii/AbiGii toxin family protein [Dactylosporangium aurantiacum]
MEPAHLRLAQIGLQVAGQYGFALAGGYAVQAHGILHRPSEDVDLFTAWERRADFAAAVEAVTGAYTQHGYKVEITQQFETFARLMVTSAADGGQSYKVELAANWRALPPVQMDIGPVLHPDDVVAGKMSALYTRAEPRDFLDVDAAITSGRYTRQRLCELAEQADAGFERHILADLFAMLERYPDRRFAFYGADPEHLTKLRARFADWRQELLDDQPSASR